MTIKLIGNLHFDNEYAESIGYVLEMTLERLSKVKEISLKAIELDAYEIVYFDSAIEAVSLFFDEDVETEPDKVAEIVDLQSERTECVTIHIGRDGFRFTGVMKHCTDLFSTGWIYFSVLDEIGETDNFTYYE